MKLWFKEKLETLNGSDKTKWFFMALIGVVVAWLVRAYINDRNAGVFEEPEQNTTVGVAAPNVKDPTMEKVLREAAENKAEMAKMRQMLEEKFNKSNNDSMTREETIRLIEELRKTNLSGRENANPFEQAGDRFGHTETNTGQETILQETTENITATPDKPKSRFSRPTSSNDAQSQNSTDDNKTYLPPGTILSYVNLTGINAPTNLDITNENAPMSLLRIKGKGLMPNGFKTDLSDCFVTAAVYGQYSDSRAVGRPVTLSCIRDDGKAVEVKLDGQINGEDGKPGWQGRVVSKDGKILAGLFKVGIAQTIGDTLSNAANGFNINIGGASSNGTARTQVNLGGAAGQSAGKNLGSAFNKMAEYFEKRGNEVFSVVEVEPLRTGEIIVQKGVMLEFSKDVK